jgi:hypothetical protein
MEACPACGHPWLEHPGGSADDDRHVCGECVYEVEHDEGTIAGMECQLHVPADIVERVAAATSEPQ